MAWSGTVAMEPGWLVYAGPVEQAVAHTTAALSVCVVTAGRVWLTDRYDAEREIRAAVAPGRAPHAVRSEGGEVVLLFVDPAGSTGRALLAGYLARGWDLHAVPDWITAAEPLVRLNLTPPAPDQVVPAVKLILDALLATHDAGPPAEHPPPLQRALDALPELLAGPVRLDELAARAGVSPDRLGRLFATELGLPFQPYLRWVRLQRAITELRGCGSLTAAAHAAGFTDSAHLTRVVREMFGVAPSILARDITWL